VVNPGRAQAGIGLWAIGASRIEPFAQRSNLPSPARGERGGGEGPRRAGDYAGIGLWAIGASRIGKCTTAAYTPAAIISPHAMS